MCCNSYRLCDLLKATFLWSLLFVVLLSIGSYSYSDDMSSQSGLPSWDINQDGQVDLSDVLIVAQHFGQETSTTSESNPDVNDDGEVNILDLIIVGSYFGEICVKPGVKVSNVEDNKGETYAVSELETKT